MDIGTAIKEIRSRKHITQKDLASKCNISANALCSIEKNTSFPSKETIKKICDALEIEASSSGDIELGNVECISLTTESSSAGDVSIESLKAETVNVEASSSGDVSIAGVCRSAKFEASSAGDIEADELKAEKVVARSSSAGDVTCYASESLEVSISSSGNVRYKGNPKQILNHSKGLQKMD